MDSARLVGFWSDDLVYVGAMEYEVVFFGADGRGCFAWENVFSTQGSVFIWELSGDRLTVRTTQEFSNDLDGGRLLSPGGGLRFDLDAAFVRVGIEDGPYGTTPLVLRIDTGRSADSRAFGYVRADCPDDLREQINQTRPKP